MNLKERLATGGRIRGTMLRILRNPALCYLAKNSDLDFVMLDCEHGSYDFETLQDIFAVGNALGLAGFVRVPVGTKDYISRVLDMGATGVMVPLVETAENVETLVKYAKYHPVGSRGFSAVGPNTNFLGGKHDFIMEKGNATTIAIAQIETRAAIENIDEIAAVPGLDALLIGPNDLSISLGVPGDLLNPVELEAIEKVARACERHGKVFGIHAQQPLLAHFARDLKLAMSLSDSDFLLRGFGAVAEMLGSL